MNDSIKAKIKIKHLIFKQYMQNQRFESDFGLLKALVNELNELISLTKTFLETLQRNGIIHYYKLKHIGQFLKHFITTKQFC